MGQGFTHLMTIEDVDQFIEQNTLAFLYISKTNCSVCHGLLPQVKQLMAKYPNIKLAHINVDDVPEIAGKFTIFAVPVLLLFVEGKEHIREARIVHMDLFKEKIDNIYVHFQ
ncbi:MAG TPA: thioredoxin family protein [Bacillota bacterium]|nr:thioredoxin family protein [Bacillota bacterium]